MFNDQSFNNTLTNDIVSFVQLGHGLFELSGSYVSHENNFTEELLIFSVTLMNIVFNQNRSAVFNRKLLLLLLLLL